MMKNKLFIIAIVAIIGLSMAACGLGEMDESFAFPAGLYGYTWKNRTSGDTYKIKARTVTYNSANGEVEWEAELQSLLVGRGTTECDAKLKIKTSNDPSGYPVGKEFGFNFWEYTENAPGWTLGDEINWVEWYLAFGDRSNLNNRWDRNGFPKS
jgi:hypothetical protein